MDEPKVLQRMRRVMVGDYSLGSATVVNHADRCALIDHIDALVVLAAVPKCTCNASDRHACRTCYAAGVRAALDIATCVECGATNGIACDHGGDNRAERHRLLARRTNHKLPLT